MSDEVKLYAIRVGDLYFSKIEWDGGCAYPKYTQTLDGARVYGSEESLQKDLKYVARSCNAGGPFPILQIYSARIVLEINNDEKYRKNKLAAEKRQATYDSRWQLRHAEELKQRTEDIRQQLARAEEEEKRYEH